MFRKKEENQASGELSTSSQAEPVEPEKTSRWRRMINILAIAAVLLITISGPFARGLGYYLVYQDTPAKSGVIVVLAGFPAVRATAAADYYQAGYAPKIFLSRGNLERADLVRDVSLEDTGEWGLAKRILMARQVPAEAVTMDGAFVGSTLDEARRAKAFLDASQTTSMILVTSKFHSRRAWQIFTRVLGPDITVISLPSKYDTFDPDRWWQDRTMAKRVVLEYQKMALAWFETAGGAEE